MAKNNLLVLYLGYRDGRYRGREEKKLKDTFSSEKIEGGRKALTLSMNVLCLLFGNLTHNMYSSPH